MTLEKSASRFCVVVFIIPPGFNFRILLPGRRTVVQPINKPLYESIALEDQYAAMSHSRSLFHRPCGGGSLRRSLSEPAEKRRFGPSC